MNIGLDHCLSFISSQSKPAGATAVRSGAARRAVTISRQAGCGALVVAEKLAQFLQEHSPQTPAQWTVFDRNLMDKVLEEHNLPVYLAKLLPEDRVTELEDMMAEIVGAHPPVRTVVRQSAETILKLSDLGNVILIGRGGNVITAKLPHVLHVRLVAPLEERVAHAKEAYGMTVARARAFCVNEDSGRERYLKKYFNADINDPLLYHLVINTGLVGYGETAKIIGSAVLNLD